MLGAVQAALLAGYKSITYPEGARFYYPMQETSGTVVYDYSGNATNGTIVNSATPITLGTDADVGKAYSFPDVASTVNNSISLGLFSTTDDFTFFIRFKPGSNNEFRNWLFSNSNNYLSPTNGTVDIVTIDSSGNKFYMQVHNGTGWTGKSGVTTLSAGTWYSLCARKNGINMDLFVNGVKEGATVTVTGFSSTVRQQYIGRVGAGPEYYSPYGLMQKACLWTRSLTDTEIANISLQLP